MFIFLAVVLLLFIVYKAGSFHVYNSIIDGIISKVTSLFSKNNFKSEGFSDISNSTALSAPPSDALFQETLNIDITDKKPVFCGTYTGNILEEASKETPGFVTDKFSVKTEKFSYSFDWRIVSSPCSYGSYLAVFTGEPVLNIFNWSKGLVYTCTVPVYPDSIKYFNQDILVFNGRDGNTYYFDLNGKTPDKLEEKKVKTPKQFFEPDVKCTASILSRLEMWTDKKIEKLPHISFFPTDSTTGMQNTSSLYDKDLSLEIYAYSPQIQGRYKIGFADENGSWSTFPAFVFVFLHDGELLTMSFEYYADKPQVEVQLSDNELYYFVCGSMDNSEMPENTCIAVKGMF